MKRALQAVVLAVFAAQTLVIGQGEEVKRVLSQIRTALGGEDKLVAVKSIAVEGQSMRPAPDGSTMAQDFELAFELPANAVKFMKKDVVMNLGNATISRRSGFSGADLIDETDMPASMGDGVRVTRMGSGGPLPANATAEQVAARKTQQLQANRREFARLAIGMLGTTTAAYPAEFVYAGQVASADGKADVLEVRAADGFAAKLYVDGKSHLPMMLVWMDKEPLRVMMGGNGGTVMSGGGGGVVRSFSTTSDGQMQDPAKMQAEMDARLKEAEAARKTVEYRLFYAEYKMVDGVRMPTRIQRMVDGLPTEEMSLDKIKINTKIDPAKFSIAK
jgi:hypothetical protein